MIENEDFAKEKLKEVGYYHLITGYKDLFRNKDLGKYKRGARFEDIYALYEFDKTLREIFFKYLQIIELTFASHISYYFCERYTSETRLYGNIVYYRTHYHNVPLWITINHLTFGSKSKMYELLQSPMQNKISAEYARLDTSRLSQTMKFLTKFRNICAHGNRLYNYKSNEDLPNLKMHERLEIQKNGAQYIFGKKDLFGIVVAFRYLLSKSDFRKFKIELDRAISYYLKSTSFLDENKILNEMGFPSNWKK